MPFVSIWIEWIYAHFGQICNCPFGPNNRKSHHHSASRFRPRQTLDKRAVKGRQTPGSSVYEQSITQATNLSCKKTGIAVLKPKLGWPLWAIHPLSVPRYETAPEAHSPTHVRCVRIQKSPARRTTATPQRFPATAARRSLLSATRTPY